MIHFDCAYQQESLYQKDRPEGRHLGDDKQTGRIDYGSHVER